MLIYPLWKKSIKLKLFKGYETIVKGEINRRSGSSIYLANLRDWMDRFAAKVVDKINIM